MKGQIVLSPVFRFMTVNGRSLTTEYPFIKHIPIVIAVSGSYVSGCAMICGTGSKQIPLFYRSVPALYHSERESSGYKYRVAPDMAITGNGVKDTPVQPQSGRDQTVAGNGGGSVRTTVGVKFPWSW